MTCITAHPCLVKISQPDAVHAGLLLVPLLVRSQAMPVKVPRLAPPLPTNNVPPINVP